MERTLPLTFASSIQTLTDLFPQSNDRTDIREKLKEIINLKGALLRFGLSIFIRLGHKSTEAISIITNASQNMEESINSIRDFLDNHTSECCSNETCNRSVDKAFFEIEMAFNICMIDLPDAIYKGI